MDKIIRKNITSYTETGIDSETIRDIVILGKAIKQFSILGTLSEENIDNLKAIQKIILFEEGKELTLDEVLDRTLQVYSKFVPYN